MGDPAVEAAERYVEKWRQKLPKGDLPAKVVQFHDRLAAMALEDAADAAREALSPVAQEIERIRAIYWREDNEEHKTVRVVLDRLSELVGTIEELSSER